MELLSRRSTRQSVTGGQGCHAGFQYVCVCAFPDGKGFKREVIVVGPFAQGVFRCIGGEKKKQKKKNMKWDFNFKLLSLLFINSSLCAFSADVPVTRSVTVINELHSPLHLIYWTDPLSLHFDVSQLYDIGFTTS